MPLTFRQVKYNRHESLTMHVEISRGIQYLFHIISCSRARSHMSVASVNRRTVYRICNERENRLGIALNSFFEFFRSELPHNREKEKEGGERTETIYRSTAKGFISWRCIYPWLSLIVSAMVVESQRNVHSLLSAHLYFSTPKFIFR